VSRYDPRAGLYAAGPAFGLPMPTTPVVGAAELESLVRFEHPAKLLAVAELPGAALMSLTAEAQAYGAAPGEVALVRARLSHEVAHAAAGLPAPPSVDGAVVALGDSITDDLQSWAELLRARGLPIVNAGVSGDTTADVLRRLHGVVELRPALVLAMLGTNDCQRHGPSATRLVAPAESARNLAAISAWLGSTVVWLTPPPVLEPALAAIVGDRPFSMRDDDTREIADLMRALGDPVVDTGATLREGDLGELLLPDGVHPSLAGQTAIARTVIGALGARSGQNHIGVGQP
jgi:lysophospholipase L1-like esterase